MEGNVLAFYQRRQSIDDVVQHSESHNPSQSQRDRGIYVAPMGYAWVDQSRVNVANSDRPQEHADAAVDFDQRARNYFTSTEGQEFLAWLKQRSGNVVEAKYGAADLGQDGAVAALVYDPKSRKGLIVANYGHGKSFDDRLESMAWMYGVDVKSIEEMVLKHEKIHQYVHASGNAYRDELGVETMLEEHFTEKRDQAREQGDLSAYRRYDRLTKVVKARKEAIKEGKTPYKKAA